jgi:hypothetical protein
MPQRASVFCNFYIRVDREALVSERALDVESVAFKAMSTKIPFTNAFEICFFVSVTTYDKIWCGGVVFKRGNIANIS